MDGRQDVNHDKGEEDATFRFVLIERPGDTVDERVRRQVKSHVSRLQHRQERERQFAAARSKGLVNPPRPIVPSTPDSSIRDTRY